MFPFLSLISFLLFPDSVFAESSPTDVNVNSGGSTLIHTLPASQPAGTSALFGLPFQGMNGGVPLPTVCPACRPSNINTIQVSVGTTRVQVFAARIGMPGTGRATLTCYNNGTVIVYVGGTGVTTANGMIVPPGGQLPLVFQGELDAVSGSAAQLISCVEVY